MEFLNSLKKWFGYKSNSDSTVFPYNHERQEEPNYRDRDPTGFNVYTNPLEMHKYFEQQVNEFIKSFGMFGNDPVFGDFENRGPFESITEDFASNSRPLREQYLKPGYEQAQSSRLSKPDSDLDGKVHITDIDSIFKGQFQDVQPVQPFRFSSQSIVSKTVQNSDGVIETHTTIRDQNGKEKTTVIKKFGDKEHRVITEKDRNGQIEIKEEFINMDPLH